MIKKFILPFLMIGLLLSSCSKETEDESEDLKAIKMESIYSIFESVARNPLEADDVISAAEKLLYTDYTELLPLTDKNVEIRGIARGYAIGGMFEAIARQPEFYDTFDLVAEKFLGPYNSKDFNNTILEFSRAEAFKYLSESMVRQPEAIDLFNSATEKYLNYSITDIP